MKTAIRWISVWLGLAVLVGSGCSRDPKSGRGFVFPEGDLAQGKSTFESLKCYECHTVKGVGDLPAPTVTADKVIQLGGEMATVKTYGALATAIIHPAYAKTAYASGRGPEDDGMPTLNETMTVKELVDIVTFLQPHYTLVNPAFTQY